jgi:hypothetical protein
LNKQVIYEWKSLEAVEDTADSVDIFSRDDGGWWCGIGHLVLTPSVADLLNWLKLV